MKKSSVQRSHGGSEVWAKAYAAFLALVALVSVIFLAKGLYLAMAVLVAAVVGAGLLVRRISRYLR